MNLATRGRRRAALTLFPGSYFVFKNLALQVPDDGVQIAPLPFNITREVIGKLVPYLQWKAKNEAGWIHFKGINENNIELVEPVSIVGNVKPTSWWCTNNRCNKFFYGNIAQIGIRSGICPSCSKRNLVQFPSVFVCPICHVMEPIQSVKCPDCKDSRSVILTSRVGRRSEYKWRCTRHPKFELTIGKQCFRDQQRMTMKQVGGRIYQVEKWSQVNPVPSSNSIQVRGRLTFTASRATVVDVVTGRTPIVNPSAYYRGEEQSFTEPFINPNTGNYICLVSKIETDAIIITGKDNALLDELVLHSMEHALKNAAPAVTGLVQDEFGSDINTDKGQIVIYDDVQGGSGGSRLLVDRRLDKWLQIAKELAECHQIQCEDACRGCLFLPSRLCREMNHNLDRHAILNLL